MDYRLVFFAGLAAMIAVGYRWQSADGRIDSFANYLPHYFKRHWKSTLAGILAWYSQDGPLAPVFGLVVLLALHIGWAPFRALFLGQKASRQSWIRMMRDQQAWATSLGSTPEERIAGINEIFDRKERTLVAVVYDKMIIPTCAFRIARNLAAMDTRQRESLRNVELLAAAGVDPEWCNQKRFGLLWGDGKASIEDSWFDYSQAPPEVKTAGSGPAWYVSQKGLTVESVVNDVLHKVESLGTDKANALLTRVLTSTKQRLTGGSGWLSPPDLPNTLFDPKGKHPLRLGVLDGTTTPLTFSGEGSLITIAPPGSGKTQCHVLPNLLNWQAPAFVLDVKGEIYAATSKWRAQHVGPVFKFSPFDPIKSHRYNPLAFIRDGADLLWKDSRLVADMMIVPSGAADPFWENKARDVLTAAIAHVCYSGRRPEERPMSRVLDIIHGGKPWDEMILGLQTAVDVKSMMRLGESLSTMSEKTRDSVLQSAQSNLSAWSGESIERMTETSDWSPLDLRSGKNPTIYICVKPNEIESYASMLRVLIAQHIMMLSNEDKPDGAPPILFLLDELPRLRYMPPVETAIEIGRSYGIKVWAFAQSFGQLENAYPNAAGMLAECAVRIYMNPSGADGTAENLSEQLGYRESVLDGTRQRLVEASDLAGPEYRDCQLVLATNCKPAKVRKAFAWQDPELQRRTGPVEVARSAAASADPAFKSGLEGRMTSPRADGR